MWLTCGGGIKRLSAPAGMTILRDLRLPYYIIGETTFYLVTVNAGKMPPVSSPSELTRSTQYVITLDRRVMTVAAD